VVLHQGKIIFDGDVEEAIGVYMQNEIRDLSSDVDLTAVKHSGEKTDYQITRFEFLNLVEQLRQETGKTFLLVMHELPEAFRTADRVIVLEAGRKVFDGTPDGCIRAGIPERVFDVRIRGTREEGFSVLPK
jgi:ABC-type uncharacterized transport system ATPase subunit